MHGLRCAGLARGIDLVRWTFGPLRGLNTSLNIGTLGAIVRTYYPDCYGEMQGINAGLPSDRQRPKGGWRAARSGHRLGGAGRRRMGG